MKYNMDDYYDNKYYAKIGGLTLYELNDLERDFLIRIGYRLFISEAEYTRYRNSVVAYIKSPKHLKRRT